MFVDRAGGIVPQTAADALAEPGLVVITGGPGIGRTAYAQAVAARTGRTAHVGGGLVTLRQIPCLPLVRAVRAPLPADDPALAVEAVRARVGSGLLVVDDAQWADPMTLRLLPQIAEFVRVLVSARTPAPLAGPALEETLGHARLRVSLGPLDDASAERVVRAAAPSLNPAWIADIVRAADGRPAVLTTLAGAAVANGPAPPPHSVAELIAELTQAERTSLAALGLLARPAPLSVLGSGGAALLARGLLNQDHDAVSPRTRLLAEVAAGVLPPDQRAAMHLRLAELVPDDGEAARHLAAGGDRSTAAVRAERAASATANPDERAEHLLLAADQAPTPARCAAAAAAALAAGWISQAARVLDEITTGDVPTTILRARIALARSQPERACELLDSVAAGLSGASPTERTVYAAARVRAEAARDPAAACVLAQYHLATLHLADSGNTDPGNVAPGNADPHITGSGQSPPSGLARAEADLLVAAAEALLAAGRDRWDAPLRRAAARLRTAGDLAGEAAATAALVAGLSARLQTGDAAAAAEAMADRCAGAAAYSWEVRLRAELTWCRLFGEGSLETALRDAGALAGHALPDLARSLTAATLALAHTDAGALPAARAALADGPASDRLIEWVAGEIDLAEGRVADAFTRASALTGPADRAGLLARLTCRWARDQSGHDGHLPAEAQVVAPARLTLAAHDGDSFLAAANAWKHVGFREQLRCLLAAGEHGAVDALLAAEKLADDAGFTVALGRIRRALRGHGMARRPRATPTPRSDGLSTREREVIGLVAEGLPSRRIADRIGVSTNTVETYVRSAMAKLGAKTRTEAAVLARGGAG